MSRTWVAVIAFAGGVGVGLLVAKLYARSQVGSDIAGVLQKVGVSESTANAVGSSIASAVV